MVTVTGRQKNINVDIGIEEKTHKLTERKRKRWSANE
jgi:hypothetical protein